MVQTIAALNRGRFTRLQFFQIIAGAIVSKAHGEAHRDQIRFLTSHV